MRIRGVVETSLYVDDIGRSVEFYQRLFGFEAMVRNDRICALNVVAGQVLLLFKKRGSIDPVQHFPTHDGDGNLHFAFAVERQELELWEQKLVADGVAIETTIDWPLGGRSIYFRDPDGHLGELVTPGTWANY